MDNILSNLVWLCIALAIIHHLIFPLWMRASMAMRQEKQDLTMPSRRHQPSEADAELPEISLILPAHNEADSIAAKIHNLGCLDYPADKLKLYLLCDGCKDDTAEIARKTQQLPENQHLQLEIRDFEINRGKVAVINEAITEVDSDIVALSDISALISIDALLIAAEHFKTPDIGVVAGTYKLLKPGSEGEKLYWQYQVAIKQSEAALGAPMGAHGAFYLFRRNLFQPLAPNIINDDFILPMQIVAAGHKAVYDDNILALELECASDQLDQHRRRRIAAGNLQQTIQLLHLMHPRNGKIALVFGFGKALRSIMPFLLLFILLGSLALSPSSLFWSLLSTAQILTYAAVFSISSSPNLQAKIANKRLVHGIYYLLIGHINGLIGGSQYLLGRHGRIWQKARPADKTKPIESFAHPLVIPMKRGFDITVAGIGLLLTLPLWPLIALVIRLDSKGPILYRQQRIGLITADRVELFWMYKFRSMRVDAEATTGAVWASKGDPRITRVGLFLRKTRLDEIPQLMNVLRGDMSIVGPRPERPQLYGMLEEQIPFFAERTYGLRPGITGLAQINQGYDESIEDVRSKVGFDHAYALSLSEPKTWFLSEIEICWKTFTVMALGRGQ